MDNQRDSDSVVAVRCCDCVYDGWPDPYSARNCYYSNIVARHSRKESSVEHAIPMQKSLVQPKKSASRCALFGK